MPGAVWIGPTGNRNPGAELAVYGFVLHIQQGTEAGTEAWQRNPASEVSSHLLYPKAGGIRQMVDTADKAWCEVAGNSHWISGEFEGRSGESLTAPQVSAAAQTLAWLHSAYGVPLRIADDPRAASVAAGGLGYHAMGGAAWGNHPDCPGQPVINQRPAIVALAAALVGGSVVSVQDVTEALLEGWPAPVRPDGRASSVAVDVSDVAEWIRSGVGAYGGTVGDAWYLPRRLSAIEAALKAVGDLLRSGQAPPSAHDIAAELISQLRPAS